MNRIRRISTELMTTYKGKFDTDFDHNKQVLNEIAVIRSKGLKNEIAGYISSYLRRELEEQEEKEAVTAHDETVADDDAEEIEEQILN